MHDIGKVGIPDSVLLKPGRPDESEYAVMKQHTIIGYDILKDSASGLLRTAAMIALTHHEKYDGSGYPRGLKGQEIPLFGRIAAVADVFDALTSERPYKAARNVSDAVVLLQNGTGGHFDPSCVTAFLKDWQEIMLIRNRINGASEGELDLLVETQCVSYPEVV